MKRKIMRSAGTIGVLLLAFGIGIAVVPVLAQDGDADGATNSTKSSEARMERGTCSKWAKADAAADGGTCSKSAKADGATCSKSAKAVAAADGGTCSKSASADGATCSKSAKAVAAADGGTCSKSAKADGATCSKGAKAVAAADGGTCSKSANAEGATCSKGAKVVAAADTGASCPKSVKAINQSTCSKGAKAVAAAEGSACETGESCSKTAQAVAKSDAACCSTKGAKNLAATATDAGSFTTLLLAAKASGLMDLLVGEQPMTVLAPTNEAFAKLPSETWVTLLQDDEQMRALLAQHILPGRQPAALLTQQKVCKNEAGADLAISHCSKNGTTIGGAKVLESDIVASNGLMHAIDAVIMPEATEEVAKAEQTEETVVASAE